MATIIFKGWICFALLSALAMQASGIPTAVTDVEITGAKEIIAVNEDHNPKVNQVLNEELGNIPNVFRNPFKTMDTGRHVSGHKTSLAHKLASMVEYLHASCRKKLAASGLAFTKLGGGYYYFHMGQPLLTWHKARDWCLTQGMVLANIENGAEDKIIINRLNNLFGQETGSNTFVWIGGNDDATNQHYVWGNGAPFGYTNWEAVPAQPTGVNCVSILKRNGHTQWDDRTCTDPGRFVCELPNPCSDILNFAKSLKSSESRSESHSSDSSHDYVIHRIEDSHGKRRSDDSRRHKGSRN